MVPFQNHSFLIGRDALIETLRSKICSVQPMQCNYRIALYGMGGVGKTGVTIGYVYKYRESYDRVYWLLAGNKDALLASYKKIAEEVSLPLRPEATREEVAAKVLVWLRQTKRWLLIFDNLDDITVINGLLPENGPNEHTLITSRDPNADGIPAQGLEVPLLEQNDALSLLARRSGLSVLPGSAERGPGNHNSTICRSFAISNRNSGSLRETDFWNLRFVLDSLHDESRKSPPLDPRRKSRLREVGRNGLDNATRRSRGKFDRHIYPSIIRVSQCQRNIPRPPSRWD
jgi:NB-ARC domain